MSASSDFEDTVKICEFYAEPDESFEVDSENYIVFMGSREINLIRRNEQLVGYLIIESDGLSHMEDDLDTYFQSVLDWEDC